MPYAALQFIFKAMGLVLIKYVCAKINKNLSKKHQQWQIKVYFFLQHRYYQTNKEIMSF